MQRVTASRGNVPGGMVFLHCNTDHHGIDLVGGRDKLSQASGLTHFNELRSRGRPPSATAAWVLECTAGTDPRVSSIFSNAFDVKGRAVYLDRAVERDRLNDETLGEAASLKLAFPKLSLKFALSSALPVRD